MKRFFQKPYRFALVFSVVMTTVVTFVLLDTFVIPKAYIKVTSDTAVDEEAYSKSEVSAESVTTVPPAPVITDTSYLDDNIDISITTDKDYDTAVYIADVRIKDASYLKTALAEDTYGRNVKAATSEIAGSNQAIFAVNGDFYGFRDYGYVLRNGVLYRDVAGNAEDLVIKDNGDFSIIDESETSIDSLNLSEVQQILSFGPALVKDGKIVVDSTSEVSQSMSSNPRTAVGIISPQHYIFIVSDGRTEESAGLSLLELAGLFADRGCTTAYNLDGGGSATMYFNGKVVNIPTDGRSFGEREVSDIVYIGY